MDKLEKILERITTLVKIGIDLQIQKGTKKQLTELSLKYESWYTQALAVVSQLIPERLNDFKAAYKLDKRKEINPSTYTISDYLIGLSISRAGIPEFDRDDVYQTKIVTQISILSSARTSAKSVLHDIRTVLRAELFDDDISAAKELVKAGYLRSAGAICGVVLEAHLKSIANRRGIKYRKNNLSIAYLNDLMKDNKVYEIPTWRLIQRLGDIRNLCDHSKDKDPTLDEVQDLLSGTDKIIKEVF